MKRILLVEDVVETRDMIEDTLTRLGFEVHSANDGEDAELFFEAHDYDLVITDLMMPNKNGFDFMKEIRKEDKGLPILAISGGGQLLNADLTTNLAMNYSNQALKKPFSKKQLIAAIRALLPKEMPISQTTT